MKAPIFFLLCLCCGFPYAGAAKGDRSEGRAVVSVDVGEVRYVEDKSLPGVVVARNLHTGKVMWRRQIYVLFYETQYGLDRCVQRCRITAMREIDGSLSIQNERGGVYLLNLKTLEVKVVKGSLVIDYRRSAK